MRPIVMANMQPLIYSLSNSASAINYLRLYILYWHRMCVNALRYEWSCYLDGDYFLFKFGLKCNNVTD